MKKALSIALGAILVAGNALPAAAASTVDFSGFYSAHFISGGNQGFTNGDNLNETWFSSRLRFDVNFQATDEVSVHWRFDAPGGRRWGDQDSSGVFESIFYYGQAVQDWGTVRVGRLDGGTDEFGLSSLGWAPNLDPEFTYIAPFEGASEMDAIQYSHTWDNGFALKASYAKLATIRDGSPVKHRSQDHDDNRFQIEGLYQWDGGGLALNLMYDRNATGNGVDAEVDPQTLVPGVEDKTSIWYVNPAVMHSWGAFSFHSEAKFGFGQTRYYNGNLKPGDNGYQKDADAEGQGVYLDFDYNYGPGRVNLAGWWVSGNDLDDTDNNAAVDIVDGNFYPLVVAYGYLGYQTDPSTDARVGEEFGAVAVANNGAWFTQRTGLLSVGGTGLTVGNDVVADVLGDPDAPGTLAAGLTAYSGHAFLDRSRSNDSANHWALMFSGQHSFTDEITLSYAAAYLALTNPNYRVLDRFSYTGGNTVTGAAYHTQDKELGWELDLGVSVQLLDNLAFTSTFGYMFTGDAYRSLKGYHARLEGGETVLKAEWEDADDSYNWVNSLVFSF